MCDRIHEARFHAFLDRASIIARQIDRVGLDHDDDDDNPLEKTLATLRAQRDLLFSQALESRQQMQPRNHPHP
jgi:hypothetical protein